MTLLTRAIDGFEILGLQSDQAEVWVAPALGGKWVSLRDRRTDREWMWSPPEGSGLFRAPDSNAFHTSSLVGADECIPTIASSHWQGRDLPDHGEVWNMPWTHVTTDDPQTLTLTVDMPVSPLRLTRTLRLDQANLAVEYILKNLGTTPEPFVWAFHPLLWILPGDQLELGSGVVDLLLESAIGLELGGRGDACAWPSPSPDVDLSMLHLGGDGRAAKFFTRPLSPADGWARIHNPTDGSSLTFAIEPQPASNRPDQLPVNTFGIWLTRGGWNNYHHLAIEPGIGAPDPLDVAVHAWQRFGTVAPHATVMWGFRLTVA